ncbi:hypothetical protein D3C86_2002890 [compost metagenome]
MGMDILQDFLNLRMGGDSLMKQRRQCFGVPLIGSGLHLHQVSATVTLLSVLQQLIADFTQCLPQ